VIVLRKALIVSSSRARMRVKMNESRGCRLFHCSLGRKGAWHTGRRFKISTQDRTHANKVERLGAAGESRVLPCSVPKL
jgi:hypothetical protein